MPDGPKDGHFIRNRTLVILVSAAVFVGAWFYAPCVDRGPVVCPLHGLVGIPCPGCGLTHAFCDLVNGRLSAAAAHNAMSFLLAALFAAALPVAAVELARRKPFAFYRFLYSTRMAWGLAGVVVVYYLGHFVVLIASGRLMTDYVMTSWTWPILHRIFS